MEEKRSCKVLVCNTGWIFGLLINYLLDWVNNKLMIVCVKVVNIFEKTVGFLISGSKSFTDRVGPARWEHVVSYSVNRRSRDHNQSRLQTL